MTEQEIRDTTAAIERQRGRIQAAREVGDYVSQHPNTLTSVAARDLASDVLTKCLQIVQGIENR